MPILTEWSSEDYRQVAEKHFKTCAQMVSTLDTIEDNTIKNALMFDLFYLSGYVVECLLKYYILLHNHAIGRKQKEDLKNTYHICKDPTPILAF